MIDRALKIVALLLLIFLIVALLCSCSASMQELGDQSKEPTTFMVIEQYGTFYTVVDSDTGVMYSVSNGKHNRGTLTLLLNADGTPKLFPGFDAREDRT